VGYGEERRGDWNIVIKVLKGNLEDGKLNVW
jgi:hypothetical protein